MKYTYRVYYGGATSKRDCLNWKDACHFMKHLLDNGWKNVRVEKI